MYNNVFKTLTHTSIFLILYLSLQATDVKLIAYGFKGGKEFKSKAYAVYLKDNLFLTSAHTLPKELNKKIPVELIIKQEKIPASVKRIDRTRDLAILESKKIIHLPELTFVSKPEALILQGRKVSVDNNFKKILESSPIYKLNQTVRAGQSGSGLYTSEHEFAGLLCAMDMNKHGYFIASNFIEKWLSSSELPKARPEVVSASFKKGQQIKITQDPNLFRFVAFQGIWTNDFKDHIYEWDYPKTKKGRRPKIFKFQFHNLNQMRLIEYPLSGTCKVMFNGQEIAKFKRGSHAFQVVTNKDFFYLSIGKEKYLKVAHGGDYIVLNELTTGVWVRRFKLLGQGTHEQ